MRRLSAEAVARRVVRKEPRNESLTFWLCRFRSTSRRACSARSSPPSSYPLFLQTLHSAAIQSIFGGRSRRMSFFSRKKHTQQQASTSVAPSPASAALAQIQQQPSSGQQQQQPQKQLSKETSYERYVLIIPPSCLVPCPPASLKRTMDCPLITLGAVA